MGQTRDLGARRRIRPFHGAGVPGAGAPRPLCRESILLYFAIWRYMEFLMREFMAVAKALADENRVRALMALRHQELCVCQLIELLELAPSTVSKHMAILKQARLVDSRKDGRWAFYRVADDEVPEAVAKAAAWVIQSLANTRQVRRDDARLEELLRISPEDLCRR